MRKHLFVDETKARGYLLVAAALPTAYVSPTRRELRATMRRGQRSMHFQTESDASRRNILAMISRHPVEALVYRAPRGVQELEAREVALRGLLRDAIANSVELVVIDRDDSVLRYDRRWLVDELRGFTPKADQICPP